MTRRKLFPALAALPFVRPLLAKLNRPLQPTEQERRAARLRMKAYDDDFFGRVLARLEEMRHDDPAAKLFIICDLYLRLSIWEIGAVIRLDDTERIAELDAKHERWLACRPSDWHRRAFESQDIGAFVLCDVPARIVGDRQRGAVIFNADTLERGVVAYNGFNDCLTPSYLRKQLARDDISPKHRNQFAYALQVNLDRQTCGFLPKEA